MKSPNLEKWPQDLKPVTGMLLFAQLWDEALFDYALDSYQPRRFNVPRLCSELIDAYDYFESHLLSSRSITPIVDELLDALDSDRICKAILGAELPILQGVLRTWNQDRADRKVAYAADKILKSVQALLQRRTVEALRACAVEAKEKEEICDLSRRLLTEILRAGYSPNFIYYSLQRRFFGNSPVRNLGDLDDFLAAFDGTEKQYDVIFKMPNTAELLAKNSSADLIDVANNLEAIFPWVELEAAFLVKSQGEVFIRVPNIGAKDEFSARRAAEERLVGTSTLVGFFKHDVQVAREQEALVYEGRPATRVYLVKSPLRSTLKANDIPDEVLDQAFAELLQAVESSLNGDKRTYSRLNGALRSHIVGVHAGIAENQFANLWTALETLAGSSPDRNTIASMLDRLVPVLCLRYFIKLVHQLRNDLRNCIPQATGKCLQEKLVNETEMETLVRILSHPSCKEARSSLYSACETNPLLRYRIFRFHELLNKPQDALKVLDEHERRVAWHIQRLYRARNVVIHAGVGYELIDLLTENVHEYFDHVLSEISQRILSDADPSMEKAFSQYQWDYGAYKETVRMLPDGPDSAHTIVFGQRT